MSDRLPVRRRSGRGRHVATRPPRHPLLRLARVGVATTLAAGLGLVVDPVLGGQAARHAPVVPFTSANAAEQRQRILDRDAARAGLAQVAEQAVAQVAQVRVRAQEARLPADEIVALDSLERQVDDLVARVEADRLDPARVSRSGTRSADDLAAGDPTAGDPTAGEPTAGGGEAAEPTETAAPAPTDPPADSSSADSSSPGPSSPDAVGADGASGPPVGAAPTGLSAPGAALVDLSDATALGDALPEVAVAEDPTGAALREAVLALARELTELGAAADAARALAAEAAEAEAERAAWADSLDGYANGRIPAEALCATSFDASTLLRCDAAAALDELDAAYAQVFGGHLEVTDSYRSYAAQVACRRQKGSLCATPGTSNHGLGVAVDFGGAAHAFGTDAHDWLLAHAVDYGWTLPPWARKGGSKPEPWHWEYAG